MQIHTPLRGARVCIRDYVHGDLPFVCSLWFDPENGRYMSDPPADRVDDRYRAACAAMEDSADGFYFVVELAETGERIGTCCAFPSANGVCCDIGYCIRKTLWRQGYGAETVRLLMAWAAARGVRKMTAEAAVENAASCGLLEKLGFQAERESAFCKYNTELRFASRIYARALGEMDERGGTAQ